MIVLRDVVQQFGGRVVLEIPELRFMSGRRYGMIGENGSGKTTLLRLLAGTSKAGSGKIEGLEGKTVGYLPQAPYPGNRSRILCPGRTLQRAALNILTLTFSYLNFN